MSFFLTKPPSSVTSRFDKPRQDNRSQAGAPSTRRYGSAFWRGSMNFAPQRPGSPLLGELERADALDGGFYADLYPVAKLRPVTPVWIELTALTTTGFTTTDAAASSYQEGAVVSLRTSLGPAMVTARTITERASPAAGTHAFFFETPLPGEFVPSRPGVTFQACFNRPHVRARIKSESLEWSTTFIGEMRPLAVEWFEDSTTMINALFAAANSPNPPGDVPSQERYLITENGRYLITEDGRYLITET